MQMEKIELPGRTVNVKLKGSLDILGVAEIEQSFGATAASNDNVIVDLKEVAFLASIGIRILVKAAKDVRSRNGRLVVYNPTDEARRVLLATGVDTIIPIVGDEAAAMAALRS